MERASACAINLLALARLEGDSSRDEINVSGVPNRKVTPNRWELELLPTFGASHGRKLAGSTLGGRA